MFQYFFQNYAKTKSFTLSIIFIYFYANLFKNVYSMYLFSKTRFFVISTMCCVIICNGSFSIGEYMAYGAICSHSQCKSCTVNQYWKYHKESQKEETCYINLFVYKQCWWFFWILTPPSPVLATGFWDSLLAIFSNFLTLCPSQLPTSFMDGPIWMDFFMIFWMLDHCVSQ